MATKAPKPTLSLKERIRAKSDEASITAAETHVIDELDGMEIEFRPMKSGARLKLMSTALVTTRVKNESGRMVDAQSVDWEKYFPQVIRETAYDPATGGLIWGDTPEDWADIAALPSKVHDRLARIGMRVSALTSEAQAALGNDSSATPDDAPISDSPAT